MRPNIGEEVGSRSPIGTMQPLESTPELENQIGDIGKLTLVQEGTSNFPPGVLRTNAPAINPLKRGPLPDIGYPKFMEKSRPGQQKSRAHHGQTRSDGFKPASTPTYDYSQAPLVDPDFARDPASSKKKLFNPERDNPFPSPTSRRSQQPEYLKFQAYPAKQLEPDLQTSPVQALTQTKVDGPKLLDNDPSSPGIEDDQDGDVDMDPIVLLQPETRPISHDQLVVEVKGIYAGLVMVESKCMDVDDKQSKAALDKGTFDRTKLKNDQWQALAHLHKTLLHEHHDFYLASQHPSASLALSELAHRYSMPSRMWRHAIYAFLEVLRLRLPDSSDHMLAFINTAYCMVALLYETVPAFKHFWIECLGDISRYRRIIPTDEPGDQDHWAGVALTWYRKAADHDPDNGRFYNRQAIITRQYTLQQLALHTRALTSITLFDGTPETLKVLFTSVLEGEAPTNPRSLTFEMFFWKIHAIMFLGLPQSDFETTLHRILDSMLDSYIGRVTAKFKEHGVCVTMTNIAALFEYGSLRRKGISTSVFRLAYEQKHLATIGQDEPQSQGQRAFDLNSYEHDHGQLPSPPPEISLDLLTSNELASSRALIVQASKLFFGVLTTTLRRPDEKNVHPLVHVSLVFLYTLLSVDKALTYVEHDIPWDDICSFLNFLVKSDIVSEKVWAEEFPTPNHEARKPLPEDFMLRGQLYARDYLPENWFPDAVFQDEDRMLELASVAAPRRERILWLGARIASVCTVSLSIASASLANL